MRTKESVFAYRRMGLFTRAGALVVLAVVAGAFFAWQAVQSASSDSNNWVLASEAGHNSNEAEDVGPGDCEGTFGAPFGTDPAWVRVGGSQSPSDPFSKAEGQVLRPNVNNTTKPNPFVTHTDAYYTHHSMDINVFLTLDPDYRHLLGNGNFANSFEANERGVLEVEWERSGIPMFAWPSTGDRLTVWGEHIWDCGHGDTWLGGDNEYRTEIHSPSGWVVYRNTADADRVPDSEEKRTRDWVWYDTGDLQGSAATFSGHGTLETPIKATVADAFFSTFGGNVPESLNGCDTDEPEPCQQDNEWHQSMLQQDYSFFVPAPAKPAGDPVLIYDSEDRCGQVPANPGDPPGDDVEDVGEGDTNADSIGAATCPITDSIQEGTDANGREGIFVTVNATDATDTGEQYIAFAKRYKVGWDFIAPPAESAKRLHVQFDTLRVYNDSEPCGEDGEWVLSLRANESWIHQVDGHGDSDTPFWTFDAVDDALCCVADCDDYQDYAINQGVDITIAHGQPIVFFSRGFDVDLVANDILPYLMESETTFGQHMTSLASGADGGEYKVIYTITDTTAAPPTPGTLTIGDPKYGPNADTGGTATRVSATTPIELTGSNATRLQYRFQKDSDPAPLGWLYDNDASDGLTIIQALLLQDGRATIEYAPVSADDIVGERRSIYIELDSTPPEITVPDSFAIEATSAAGRNVEYTATAEDELPGPVTFSCTPPSGSFFLIKHVTTVTCTASDAVGNSDSKSFTIEVFSPFGYIPDFVLLSRQWTNVGSSVVVQTGNIGAFDASAGAPSFPGFEVVLGPSAIATGGPQVAAHSVRLQSNTHVGEVYYVDQVQQGSGVTYTAKSGYVPLFLGMPIVPAFGAGGANKNFSGAANVLAAGSYGKLKLSPNAVVTLTGGNYYFTSVELGSNAQLLFSAATNVHVTGRVNVGNSAKVRPATGSGIVAHDIVFWVGGTDGPPASPTAFNTSNDAQLEINVYAFNGTLTLGQYNAATGAFLGLRVNVSNSTTLNLDSAFDYPYP